MRESALMNGHEAPPPPWESAHVPGWTRAPEGSLTSDGQPATFRSSTHAWFAIRLVYLAEVAGLDEEVVLATRGKYERAWNRYVRHGHDMQRLVALASGPLEIAADLWNGLKQAEIDEAFSTAICEREPHPADGHGRRINLASVAERCYGLRQDHPPLGRPRDRKLRKSDSQAAWEAAEGGRCLACDTPTISQLQYDALRKVLRSGSHLFDLTPTYRQRNGVEAPLWSQRVLIAAKGVADHVIPWSHGGRTSAENLANVCAACNYSRGDGLLHAFRVAALPAREAR